MTLSSSVVLLAQKTAVDDYHVRVVTKSGVRLRGILDEVTDTHLRIVYINSEDDRQNGWIPLTAVRKVVVRRTNKTAWRLSGVGIGAVVAGLATNKSFQKKRIDNPMTYITAITVASVGGAAAGLVLSTVLGNLSKRVIRPDDTLNPADGLQRRLEPFSLYYQQRLHSQLLYKHP